MQWGKGFRRGTSDRVEKEEIGPTKAGNAPGRPDKVARDQDLRWVAGYGSGLSWYGEAGRELPWRASPGCLSDPGFGDDAGSDDGRGGRSLFRAIHRRFPDVAALAAADEAEVVKAWEGLGYYRRARQLHAAARTIVREHGGVMPDDPAAVRALPGVGRYIAGAILSFAIDRPEPIVEANSQRVLARLLAVREDIKVASTRERLWQAAARLVPAENAGAFNQALMDLGALVCTPREPAAWFARCRGCARRGSLGFKIGCRRRPRRHLRWLVTEAAVVLVRSGGS